MNTFETNIQNNRNHVLVVENDDKKMALTMCLPNNIYDNSKKIFIILFQHPGDLILEYMLATEDDDTLLINIIKEEEILATAKYVIMKFFPNKWART